MEIKTIFLIVIVIVLLILVINYFIADRSKLTSMADAKTMQTIAPAQIQGSNNTSASNFSYSIWFYIDDWNYLYGQKKIIFGRMDTSNQNPCPVVSLGATVNNIDVNMTVYPDAKCTSTGDASCNTLHTCSVWNVPIQRWVNLIVSCYGRTLDVYIDGKLVRTCVMPGVANISSASSMYVTPNGGFAGYTALFQYWSTPCDPQKAWNVYKSGYGANMLSQYGVKIALMDGTNEASSVHI